MLVLLSWRPPTYETLYCCHCTLKSEPRRKISYALITNTYVSRDSPQRVSEASGNQLNTFESDPPPPPSAEDQVLRCRPWSFGPGPQLPADCGGTASGGSWPGMVGWREDAAPGRPCTCRKSEPRRLWPRPAAVLTHGKNGMSEPPPVRQAITYNLSFKIGFVTILRSILRHPLNTASFAGC